MGKLLHTLIKEIFIKDVSAAVIKADLEPTCYAVGPQDAPIHVLIKSFNYISLILGPIILIIKTAFNIRRILRKGEFSVTYEIYRSIKEVLIVTVIFVIIYFGIALSFDYYGIFFNAYFNFPSSDIKTFIMLYIAANSIACGIIYLPFSFKSVKFLKLALSLIFISPAFAMYVWILLCKYIPKFNKYLPSEAIEKKKKDLEDKFIAEGKIEK